MKANIVPKMSIYYLIGEDGDHLYNRIFNNEDSLLQVLKTYKKCFGTRSDFDEFGEAFPVVGYYYLTKNNTLAFVEGHYAWR